MPFTEFLGVRFDERYGDTFVYLHERTRKRIVHEFHPGVGSVTKHKNIDAGMLRSIKKDIAKYDEDMEDCDDDEIRPAHMQKKSMKKEINSEVTMFN